MHCLPRFASILVIVLNFGNVGNASDGCHWTRKYAVKRTIKASSNYSFASVFIQCNTTNTVFEVRYSNNSLCVCGRTKETPRSFRCKHRFPSMDINVVLSNNVKGGTCNVTFNYVSSIKRSTTIKIDIPDKKPSKPSPSVVSSIVPTVVSFLSTEEPVLVLTPVIIGHPSSRMAHRSSSKTIRNSSSKAMDGLSSKTIRRSSPKTVGQSSTPGPMFTTTTLLRRTAIKIDPMVVLFSSTNEPILVLTPVIIGYSPSTIVYHSSSKTIRNSSSKAMVRLSPKTIHRSSYSKTVGQSSSLGSIFATTVLLSSATSTKTMSSYSSIVSTPLLSTSLIKSFLAKPPVLNTTSLIQASPTSSLLSMSTTLSLEMQEELKYNEDDDYINNINTSNISINDTKTLKRVLDAATNLINSNRSTADKEDRGMKAVQVLQDLGKAISEQLDLGNERSVTFQETRTDLVFGVAVINTTSSSGYSFPSVKSNEVVGDEKIDVPSSVFKSKTGKAFFVGIIFSGVSEMRNKTGDEGFVMGSKVISAEVSPPPSASLTDPVKMTFEKKLVGNWPQEDCSFWIEDSSLSGEHGRWSTEQCEQVFRNKTHVQCVCYHLTNFAVLFKITNGQDISEDDSFRLEIITYVGLAWSILGCFLTFAIYVSFSSIKSDRATIHTNLVFALGVADIIFLITVAVKPVEDTCLALAMVAFFFYLAVFFWMFVEGIYIYLMVIKVFRGNVSRRRRSAYLLGWGCPVVIALVTWAILREDVVSKYHCWLSVNSGAIWAFVGPGLFIILVNLIILMVVMRTTWATFVDDKEYGGLKSATKTFGAVIPVLGITWVFGVMAFNETSIVFQYIFAITNSIQGILIFILYCLVNNEVRNEIRRRITVWQTRREISCSSAGRRPTYAISSEKNTTYNRSTQSGNATPDLSRYPLNEMKDPTVDFAENGFADINSAEEIEKEASELNKDCDIPQKDQDIDANLDSGRSSPSNGHKDDLENYYEDNTGYV